MTDGGLSAGASVDDNVPNKTGVASDWFEPDEPNAKFVLVVDGIAAPAVDRFVNDLSNEMPLGALGDDAECPRATEPVLAFGRVDDDPIVNNGANGNGSGANDGAGSEEALFVGDEKNSGEPFAMRGCDRTDAKCALDSVENVPGAIEALDGAIF